MRINKYLAHATGLSRREADSAISAGRVRINGVSADLGAHIKDGDIVTFDGKNIAAQQNYTYLMLNKPAGYLCSRRSQGGTPTIYRLVAEKYRALKLVGRLDRDSSGLILLTDDGDFAFRMTHPKFLKTKVYEVQLDKTLQPLHQQMISDYGIHLEDGLSKFVIEKIEQNASFSGDSVFPRERDGTNRQLAPSESNKNESRDLTRNHTANVDEYRITMSEGRNRQIRRTFSALGYTVTKLHRTHFGNYALGDMKSGDYKPVDIR